MRNKNTIIALLAIFSLICAFNLFYTWRQFSIEGQLNEASPEAEEELRRDKSLMASYETAQRNAFSLGLDLQGGLFVTMEVGVEDILREYAKSSVDAQFEEAIQRALQVKVTSDENLVELFSQELTKVYTEKNLPIPKNQGTGESLLMARYFASSKREISSTATDAEIKARLIEDTNVAIQNTFTIIRSRIDQFGVASPNLQLQEGTGRILLELPGVKDPKRVKKLLRNSAKLEFRETHNYGEIFQVLERINNISKRVSGLEDSEDDTDSTIAAVDTSAVDSGANANAVANANPDDSTGTDSASGTSGVEDLFANGGNATTDDSGATAGTDSAGADSVNQLSTDEQIAQFKEENPFLGLFDLTIGMDPSRPMVGRASILDTAAINKWLRHPEVTTIMPTDLKFLWEAKPQQDNGEATDKLGLIAIKTNREDLAPLEGNVITRASQDYEQGSTNAVVNMQMNSEGAKIWARLTKDNVNRCVAIVLDDLVQSYPNVNGMINGGNSQISGNFTVAEAKDLANLLKAGALPVKAKILGDTTIGPSLGAENLSKGLFSFLIAFLATIAFMFFYYTSSGMVANVALLVNLFYILGVSAALNVVFTLPGLAAIVLTMGMAVDANVLIFERIREEQAHGKSFKAAIASGFKNAFSSVMDANITTFLTGLILFSFGVGPIRGFAVSLMIGIITSLISALFITRIILEYYANKGTDSIKFGSNFTLNVFSKIDMKMTVRKKVMYGVSAVLVAGSIISIATLGFKTGVDFEGGRQYQIAFNRSVTGTEIRDDLTDAFEKATPLIRAVDNDTTLMITTSYRNDEDNVSEEIDALLLTTLEKAAPGTNAQIVQSTRVGPTVAKDIRNSAVYSVIFSLLIIFLYILIRFRRYQYSLGAIAALFHDVTIVLGIFSFVGSLDLLPFSLEVDQAFIAAALTIIGYSINDTVVVFDRIRENFGEMRSSPISEVYDTSINQTISRTLITSVTTLITVLILFFFAGEVIRGFMFALFVGIIVGTYSSIFVASPISHDLIKASENKPAKS